MSEDAKCLTDRESC